MHIPFVEIVNRISGISTPIFGFTWTPPVLDRQIAARLLAFLEDRRALTNERQIIHNPRHVVESILEIRKRLTTELEAVGPPHHIKEEKLLGECIRAMRTACRKFLDSIARIDTDRPMAADDLYAQMVFLTALGELRSTFGLHIARLCVAYGIDVESDLAAMLPALPAED